MHPSCPALPLWSVPDSCWRQTSWEGTQPGGRYLTGHGETRGGVGCGLCCSNPAPCLSPDPGPDHGGPCPPQMGVTPLPSVPSWEPKPSRASQVQAELAFQLVAQNPESCPSLFSVWIRTLGKMLRHPKSAERCSLVGGNRVVLILFIEWQSTLKLDKPKVT